MVRSGVAASLVLALLLAPAAAGCLGYSQAVAPDFKVATVASGNVSLSQYGGHVVVLDLMATTCGPCKKQEADLLALNASHPGVRILSVSLLPADDLGTMASWKAHWNATWPHGVDPSLMTLYRVATLPNYVVVTPTGRIAYQTPPDDVTDRSTLFQQVAAAS